MCKEMLFLLVVEPCRLFQSDKVKSHAKTPVTRHDMHIARPLLPLLMQRVPSTHYAFTSVTLTVEIPPPASAFAAACFPRIISLVVIKPPGSRNT